MCCTAHSCFTIYPPGFSPYQRKSLGQAAYGNSGLVGTHWPKETCRDSLFQAALDGSEGKAWLRYWVEGPRQWWESQRRDISKAQSLLGLALGMTQAEILAVATILDIDYLLIAEARAKIGAAPGYQCRGKGVRMVLNVLMNKGSPLERLQLAGCRAGLWGKPLWWDSESKILRENPFRIAGSEVAGKSTNQ